MYFVLYDRFLNSIGETYILESWSRTQRAMDFDDLRIVGEQIPYSAEPFLVVVNDRQGKQVFSGLASTPEIDDKSKKTTLSLKDYTTLFNSEIIVDWSQLSDNCSLGQYLHFIFTAWKSQVDIGFESIILDTNEIEGILWDSEAIPLGKDTESVLLYDLVRDAMNYYDVFCLPNLDVYRKTLTFKFKESGTRHVSIRLKDFGINSFDKSFGEYNRATVYSSTYTKDTIWALTTSNGIVKLPSTENLVYPGKNRNFISKGSSEDVTEEQALWNANYEAIMGLAANRYQEDIELNLKQYASISGLEELTFDYVASVYTEEGFYRDLPVGEIESDSNGKHIIRLGRRVQELTQEI